MQQRTDKEMLYLIWLGNWMQYLANLGCLPAKWWASSEGGSLLWWEDLFWWCGLEGRTGRLCGLTKGGRSITIRKWRLLLCTVHFCFRLPSSYCPLWETLPQRYRSCRMIRVAFPPKLWYMCNLLPILLNSMDTSVIPSISQGPTHTFCRNVWHILIAISVLIVD